MRKPVFGEAPPESVVHPRRAAYAVFVDDRGRIAVVRGKTNRQRCYWLPGGGSRPGETPEETLEREVGEELGHQIEMVERIAQAVQVFYAEDEECWYRMETVFMQGELGPKSGTIPEHEVEWLDRNRTYEGFFHASHAWAVQQCGVLENGGQS